MALPTQPVTLSVEQVEELSRHFSAFRHDVNGCVSIIGAASELIRYNPDAARRMASALTENPPKIAGKVEEFIAVAERIIGLRPGAGTGWYEDLWKRHNCSGAVAEGGGAVPPEQIKTVFQELLQLGKELAQMGFIVSGAHVISAADAASAADVTATAVEQLPKVSRRYEQAAAAFEKAFGVVANSARHMPGGSPTGPVTLSADEIALFHRRLTNLRRDILDHLKLLLEFSRLARTDGAALQSRAPDLAGQPPKIAAEIASFSDDFDRMFRIVRP